MAEIVAWSPPLLAILVVYIDSCEGRSPKRNHLHRCSRKAQKPSLREPQLQKPLVSGLQNSNSYVSTEEP